MEGSERDSISKPYSDEEKHQSHQQEEKKTELGLGFQSSDSSPPRNTDPVLDPPLPADDLDQQTMNEEPADDLDQQVMNEEHQNRQTITEELQDQQAIDEELLNQQAINEELLNQQAINEELLNQQAINEELLNQQAINEELYFQQKIIEEFQKLTMEEKDAVYTDREEDVKSEENERSERDADHEEYNNWSEDNEEDKMVNYNENKNEDMDYKDYFDRNDDDDENDKSENEEEESLGGDSTAMSKDGKYRRYHYPLRPDAEDCSYYMKTGSCKFGSNCKFNHPLRRRNQAAKEKVKEMEENPERPGQIECKYYLTSGGCKFGKACRYNHSRGKTQVAPILELNFLGLPIRPGERECPYYMRNGSCKYGSNCRFNHPDPTAVGGGEPPGYGNNGSVSLQGASQSSVSSWSSPRALNDTTPFVPIMFPPTQGIPSSNAEWNGYQAPAYPISERSLPTPPAFAMNSTVIETNFYAHHQRQMVVEDYPERPGQPDCTYFMKTGDCKFRSGCKFHHPKSRIPKTTQCNLSDKGLPLRPDQNICSHYNRYGICKFGPACKFDHPVNYADSVPSGVSGPDHPPLFMNSMMADGATMAGGGNGN